ncbi:MAG: hypothetical protein ACE5EM_01300 [Sphingomonadales bacterium]
MSAVRPIDHLQKARAAWSEALPDWIDALARAANEKGLRGASRATGVSKAAISQVLANKYGARLDRLERVVRLTLLPGEVDCPALATTIATPQCLAHQRRGTSSLNPIHVRLSRTCPTCNHNERNTL